MEIYKNKLDTIFDEIICKSNPKLIFCIIAFGQTRNIIKISDFIINCIPNKSIKSIQRIKY